MILIKTIIKAVLIVAIAVTEVILAYKYQFARGGLIFAPVVFALYIWLSSDIWSDIKLAKRSLTETQDEFCTRCIREATGQEVTEQLTAEEVIL